MSHKITFFQNKHFEGNRVTCKNNVPKIEMVTQPRQAGIGISFWEYSPESVIVNEGTWEVFDEFDNKGNKATITNYGRIGNDGKYPELNDLGIQMIASSRIVVT